MTDRRLHPAVTMYRQARDGINYLLLLGTTDKLLIEDHQGEVERYLVNLESGTEGHRVDVESWSERTIQVVGDLERRGHLVAGDAWPALRDRAAAQLDFCARATSAMLREVQPNHPISGWQDRSGWLIVLHGEGHVVDAAERFCAMLEIKSRRSGKPEATDVRSVHVVCSDSADNHAIQAVNRELVRHSASIVSFAIVLDYRVQIGPLFVSGEGSCYDCLQRRTDLALEFPEARSLGSSTSIFSGPCSPKPALAGEFAAMLVVLQAARALSGMSQLALPGELVEGDLLTGRLRKSIVPRMPFCTSCGAVRQEAPRYQIRHTILDNV